MADNLAEVLARFHRDVLLPDIQKVVGESELRLRDEMHALLDAQANRLDRLETEYQMIVAGLRRIEARLEAVERRLDEMERRMALRSEVDDLKARVEALQKKIAELEAEL